MTFLWGLHVSLVSLSVSLFLWRGICMWQEKNIKSDTWKRRIPDSIDSVLFISGMSLAYILGFAPWNDSWLMMKILALLIYIGFGFMALREGSALWLKRMYFILALFTVSYMIAIAHNKVIAPWDML